GAETMRVSVGGNLSEVLLVGPLLADGGRGDLVLVGGALAGWTTVVDQHSKRPLTLGEVPMLSSAFCVAAPPGKSDHRRNSRRSLTPSARRRTSNAPSPPYPRASQRRDPRP